MFFYRKELDHLNKTSIYVNAVFHVSLSFQMCLCANVTATKYFFYVITRLEANFNTNTNE